MADTVATLRAVYEADSAGFDRALNSIQGGINKTVGMLAGLAGGIATAFAAGDTIQKALEFDSTLANIRSTTKATAEDTAALGEMLKATVAGSAIKDGLNEIGGAYYEIVGGVQDATMQQEIFTNAVALAEAGQASMASTTNALIGAMNNYGASGLTAANASDILQRAVDMGKTNMTELGTALGPIAGNAAAAGLSFEELAADTALITTKNVSASVAATRVNAALSALKTPNEAMKKGLKELGFESGEAAVKQLGLQGTLSALNDTLKDTPGAFNTALGSTEAQGAAAALLGDNYDAFFKTFTEGIDGATAKARELQLDSVSAQFTRFQNELSVVGLSIGQAFLPALNTLLSGFNAFAGDVQKMGLGPAIEKWWNAGIDWLQTNGPAILQSALKAALDIGQDIVTFVATNGPNVIAGVIGLWEGIKTWFTDTGAGLFQDALKAGLKIAQDIGSFVINNAPDIVGGIERWVNDAWLWITTNFGALLGDGLRIGLKAIGDIGALISENAPDIGTAVGNWIRGAFTGLGSILQDALAGVFSGGAIDTSGLQGGDIAADLIPDASVFEQLAQGAVDAMVGVFQTGINLISGLFEGLFGLDKGAIKGFFDAFLGTEGPIAKFKTGIISVWNSIFGTTGALQTAVNALAGGIGGVFETLKTTVFGILKPLLEPLATLMKAISLAFYALGDGDHAKAAADAALAIEGMKATGGPVMAGRNYIVGEKGPEILNMGKSSGSVIPHNQLNSIGGGSGGGSLSLHGVTINGVTDPETFLDKLMEEAGRRGLQLTF